MVQQYLDGIVRSYGSGLIDDSLAVAAGISDQCQSNGVLLDRVSHEIIEGILREGGHRVVSDVATFQRLGVDRKKLRTTRMRYVVAAFLVERSDALKMIERCCDQVHTAGGRAILLSQQSRFDETKMTTRVRDPSGVPQLADGAHQVAVPSAAGDAGNTADATVVSKLPLLSTDLTYIMLFRVGDSYLDVSFFVTVPVQAMGRGIGEGYATSLAVSGVNTHRVEGKFEAVQRVFITDGDGAISRAERFLSRPDIPTHRLHLKCFVHKVCTLMEDMASLHAALASVLANVALSVKGPGAVLTFRKVVREVVMSALTIVRDALPPMPVLARNERLLNLLLPEDTMPVIKRRTTLLSMASGDWSDPTHLVHYVTSDLDDDAIKAAFRKMFVDALVGDGPHSFPSRSWVGAGDTPTWVGCLLAIHNIFPRRFSSSAVGCPPASRKNRPPTHSLPTRQLTTTSRRGSSARELRPWLCDHRCRW